ncbi:DUF4426 domain-containing protein [Pseudoxanthomonas sp.]|uniref:DUF4426 domain-containing protein n=1 Tax=Pseudoxanthomonas sp. TaxID=1871049 RepID=UPI0025851E0B|nr:DUF4426 domain-containing protein [Pseudoxanthomonas sp.]MCR6687480.1 DUF4426 domain-containing protein [Pseudoxanthomonas sp.]
MSRPRPGTEAAPRRPWPVVLAALLTATLAACGGGQAPVAAQFVPPAPAVADLQGPLRAHYNLLPTLALSEAVARQYGIERSAGQALLVVALRRPGATPGDEIPAEGQVQARARNLAGQQQEVALRAVGTGDYIDHIGTVAIGTRDMVRIEVSVDAGGRRQQFDFQRNF